ncbi:MAG: hypothetical protein ACRETN_13150 [Nevskiales bacterium]
MKLTSILAIGLVAVGLTACGKSEPPSAPVAAPASAQHEGMAHSQMQGDCEMQGMDMSKMSAADHQAMMEKCQPSGMKSDGYADHADEDHGSHQ